MKRYLSWIFADLLLHKRFTFLFVLNLSIGLTGFVALDSFRHHLEDSLELKSRLVLGADLGMSSRHPISEDQKQAARKVLEGAPESHMTEAYSMVASLNGDSRLVQIKAIENSFPFYGEILLQNQGPQNPSKVYDLVQEKKVWVYPEVLSQLGVTVGDILKVGTEKFIIADVVIDDSASGFSTSMAPRVYVGLNFMDSTGLITPQSIAWYSTVYKKPLDPVALQNAVETLFSQDVVDEGVRVYSHKSVSAQMSRMLSYLNDYLGLVSIAAIFLASIGATFLFRSYVNGKVREIAIFRSLGLTFGRALTLYFWQILILGFAASCVTFVLSLSLTPFLAQLLNDLVAVPIVLSLRWQGFAVAFLLGTLGSLFICLPLLVQLKGLKPALLFQNLNIRLKENVWSFALHILAVLTLWSLAVWQSNSWVVGTSFIGIFIGCGALLGGVTFLAIWLFDRFGGGLPLTLRLALRSLVGEPKSSIPCFLALGMGVILLNVVPQIEASLQMELENPEASKLPSFFLFDIQEDQLENLKNVVAKEGEGIGQISPMIRGRLLTVNGKAFEKINANKKSFSREEQEEARFRNRGFNLSYRGQLDPSESIVEGRGFSGEFDLESGKPAEISVERRFAERLGLKMGDRLKFEVQGVPIESEIINLRSVRWTSFQPNFFVQFQPGVLNMAPKTFVVTIQDMLPSKKIQVQNHLVEKIPNVSIIDVTRIVKRLTEVSSQMSLALQFMAILCLLVGLLVMYSISSHQAKERRRDINLMKVLGAPYPTLRSLFILEFAILAGLAGGVGIMLSIGVSYGLSTLLFDSIWAWSPWVPLTSFLLVILLVSGLAYLSVAKVLRAKTSFYL